MIRKTSTDLVCMFCGSPLSGKRGKDSLPVCIKCKKNGLTPDMFKVEKKADK